MTRSPPRVLSSVLCKEFVRKIREQRENDADCGRERCRSEDKGMRVRGCEKSQEDRGAPVERNGSNSQGMRRK